MTAEKSEALERGGKMESVLEYLQEAAGRFPEKIAAADESRSISYGALLEQSRQVGAFVAHREKGCRPVGVWAKHSAATPLLFFGAVWGGCFYVPLDPEMPAGKLQKLLDDSGLDLILAEEETALPEGTAFGGEVVPLERALQEGGRLSLPDPVCEGDRPLYLMYTSGSTGAPKGVLKSHRAVRSFVEAFLSEFSLSREDVFGNQTPFFFDASAKDLYLSLRLAARLEILDAGLFSFPVRLIEAMNRRGVTCISWVPSALSIVTQLNTFSEVKPQGLRKVFFVGEVFPMKQLNRWREALPETEFVNLYGSTELAGICCCYKVEGSFGETEALPIGKALSNSRVFLEKDGSVLTRPGEIGELCVASQALALGYYNDEEKTSAAFRREELPGGEVLRVFHTGDLAQYREDGLLVFAARKDHQFKHMGRRIEAGEIEAAALALEGISKCCCLYQQERGRIVLFCELSPGAELTSKEIRKLLRDQLSDYMVPGKVVLLPQIPLNANGKIDRPALRERLAML